MKSLPPVVRAWAAHRAEDMKDMKSNGVVLTNRKHRNQIQTETTTPHFLGTIVRTVASRKMLTNLLFVLVLGSISPYRIGFNQIHRPGLDMLQMMSGDHLLFM